MSKTMLIDASQAEELRVAVTDGSSLDDFESENDIKRQIKGSIYLAKITRVEPSLQAAFVEYGGNRHGFLPFSEIHPDYYRIPVSDREKLVEEMAKISAEQQEARELDEEENLDLEDDEEVHTDALQDLSRRGIKYKIQEVIQHRQILLVQVVKEERGNKGAALTTYLGLPGRYCVLMPNAGYRSGGVSRKIQDGADRKRLREIIKDLEIPQGMALIVRTAGQNRSKVEIKRDFEYLTRLWNEIRDKTIESTAPDMIYAEGDLIKRAIRDLYGRDIDEIIVSGEEAFKQARGFMKALMPSHVKKVKLFEETHTSLFQEYKIEEQVDRMMDPTIKLPSGGSIVIHTTEALVAIDVNSGKSTRERHITDTALKTNMEAAEEVARQLRLRDLGGLIVIDFIDMNEQSHINKVERKLRESLKNDRAKIQVGHISQFGLLEMSRQRMKSSLMETHSVPCSHCTGTGFVRSVESLALQLMRAIEATLTQCLPGSTVKIFVPADVDLFLLNQKRQAIVQLESRFEMQIEILRDVTLSAPNYRIEAPMNKKVKEKKHTRPRIEPKPKVSSPVKAPMDLDESDEDVEETEEAASQEMEQDTDQNAVQNAERKNRSRNRRRRNNRPMESINPILKDMETLPEEGSVQASDTSSENTDENGEKRPNNNKRRRNRLYRGRNRRPQSNESGAAPQNGDSVVVPFDASSSQKSPQPSGDADGGKESKGWLRRLLDV